MTASPTPCFKTQLDRFRSGKPGIKRELIAVTDGKFYQFLSVHELAAAKISPTRRTEASAWCKLPDTAPCKNRRQPSSLCKAPQAGRYQTGRSARPLNASRDLGRPGVERARLANVSGSRRRASLHPPPAAGRSSSSPAPARSDCRRLARDGAGSPLLSAARA